MLSTPDFRAKNIAFLNASALGATSISFRNENIVITRDGATHDKIPLRNLLAIFLYGNTTISTPLLDKCATHGTSLFFLTRNLRTYASINAAAEGNYILRQRQYELSENDALHLARHIVMNKVTNQLALLRSVNINTIRDKRRMQYKNDIRTAITNAENTATLRGIEGTVSRDFFGLYFGTIGWYKRIPRERTDPNNILLDMGYSMLFNFTDALLRLYGFDVYKGIYHRLYYQRKSLSCDMMEPFRCIIDRALYKMHTLKQYDKKIFAESGGVTILILENRISMREYFYVPLCIIKCLFTNIYEVYTIKFSITMGTLIHLQFANNTYLC